MNNRAFSLIEIMITIILVGLVAAFAIPNYARSARRATQEQLMAQAFAVYAANDYYLGQAGDYWNDGGGSETDVDVINAGLGISLIPVPGFDYMYQAPVGATGFVLRISPSAGNPWEVRVTSNLLSATNPCCDRIALPSTICQVNAC